MKRLYRGNKAQHLHNNRTTAVELLEKDRDWSDEDRTDKNERYRHGRDRNCGNR